MQLKKAIDIGITMEQAFSANSSPEARSCTPSTPIKSETANPAESASIPMPVAVPKQPWHRTMLAWFRPLVLPVLNRVDSRIRWAVDRSNVMIRLTELERKADEASAHSRAATLDMELRLTTRIEHIIVTMANKIDVGLDKIDIGLDATRMRVAALSVAHTTATAHTRAALSSLEESGGAWLDQRMAEHLETLDRASTQRLAPLQASAERLDARSDALLRRNVIALGRELAIRTTAGYVLAPTEDPAVLVGLVEGTGMLEPGTTAVLQALLQPGSVMIDVGGHIGTLTLPAARRTGPTGRVIALEPAPRLADLLRRTMVLNHIDWVDVHECAAGEANATATFALSTQTGHNSLFPIGDTVQQIEVSVRPLDALVPPNTRIDVVKVDAEGAELQVWRGMQRILAENPALAILLEFGPKHIRRAGSSIAAWLAEVTSHGHTPWEIEEETGHVRPLRKAGLDDVFSFNLLLLRDHPSARGLLAPVSTIKTALTVSKQEQDPPA
jgi:FkbM family methyltransferase